MGSLQTEIQKTLEVWNTPPTTSNTIAQRIFNFVKDNPTCTSTDVSTGVNIDTGRTSATLLSLYQKGKLDRKAYPNPNPDGKRDEVFSYWTAVNNYKDKAERRIAKKPKKVKPSVEKAVIRLRDTFEMPRMKQFADKPSTSKFDPEHYVKGLSLTEVKALHKFLESYFE
jgi:predicted transcriptional regulator